jgi:hypothetical protein
MVLLDQHSLPQSQLHYSNVQQSHWHLSPPQEDWWCTMHHDPIPVPAIEVFITFFSPSLSHSSYPCSTAWFLLGLSDHQSLFLPLLPKTMNSSGQESHDPQSSQWSSLILPVPSTSGVWKVVWMCAHTSASMCQHCRATSFSHEDDSVQIFVQSLLSRRYKI